MIEETRHPPFESGNTAALKHGATSPRLVAPLAETLAAEIAEVAPWTSQCAFRGAVESLAWTWAQATVLRAWMNENGALDAKGRPRPAVALSERLEGRICQLRASLGMTPTAWSKLVATMGSTDVESAAAALEQLRSIGRELSSGLQAPPS
jgi:hypothetical protein